MSGFGIHIHQYIKYTQSEKIEIIRIDEGSSMSVKKTLEEIGVSRSTFL
jgi:hypothetical protein